MDQRKPNVVVMNDTSGRNHHGCARVMRLLVEGLERHGLNIIARSPARHAWSKDGVFLARLATADLIVINGEGTLHHGRDAGAQLLAVLDHPARGTTPVALVNALWQANPPDWVEAVGKAALIAVRDGQSAAELGAMIRADRVRVVPDLSLSAGFEPQPGPRHRLVFGDSVRLSTRRSLAKAARRVGADQLLPTKTLRGRIWRAPGIRDLLSSIYNSSPPFGMPRLALARDEADYLRQLGQARMHVTGRFHAVCLSLVTGTPFLAVGSNSWKVEALMADAGLGTGRSLPIDALESLEPGDLDRPFVDSEVASIKAFLDHAQKSAEMLFRDLAALADSGAA